MARVNKSKINFKALDEWMKALERKVSIKVGIIGSEAAQIHEGTNLTNADLGAAHEFGATINHPGGQPYYINSSTGMAVFVSKTSAFGKYLISKGQITKPHEIILPTRSFLRMPLLSSEGKKELMNAVKVSIGKDFKADDFTAKEANKIIDDTVHFIAETAYLRVLKAFENGGFGKWASISEFTRQRRKAPDEPPLTDSGDLRRSISYAVNNKQWAKPPYGDLK